MKIQIQNDEIVAEKDKDGRNKKTWRVAVKIIDNELPSGLSEHTLVILTQAGLEREILSILSDRIIKRIK